MQPKIAAGTNGNFPQVKSIYLIGCVTYLMNKIDNNDTYDINCTSIYNNVPSI